MAVVSPTADNLRLGSGASVVIGVAGLTLVPFQWCYQSSNGKYLLCDSAEEISSVPSHITIGRAVLDQNIALVPVAAGSITTHIDSSSALWIKGETYVVAPTASAGKLQQAEDTSTGEWVSIAGVAVSTTSLQCHNSQSGIEK
jgi:hypothetical protein